MSFESSLSTTKKSPTEHLELVERLIVARKIRCSALSILVC